jgi:hypothetical protein
MFTGRNVRGDMFTTMMHINRDPMTNEYLGLADDEITEFGEEVEMGGRLSNLFEMSEAEIHVMHEMLPKMIEELKDDIPELSGMLFGNKTLN